MGAASKAPAPARAPEATVHVQRQPAVRVSSRHDPAEAEAEATARKVVGMPLPASTPSVFPASQGPVMRSVKPPPTRFDQAIALMRRGAGPLVELPRAAAPGVGPRAVDRTSVAHETARAIINSGAGSPLPASVRRFMEPRFRANFAGVRIHADERAAGLARALNAHAFTRGNEIFFGRGKFQPDTPEGRELLAHELTHTIQQGAAPQEDAAIHRSEDVTVTQSTAPSVQGSWLPGMDTVLDFFADAANAIPGFRMFTIVLGVNPITMRPVERSTANILRAVVEFLPGGNLVTRVLDAYGVFDKVGSWVDNQLKTLGISGASIKAGITAFLDTLTAVDIFDPAGVWGRAKAMLGEPVRRMVALVGTLGGAILGFIRDAVLRPLAQLASQTPGWDLLCAVIGRNPITGETVPRNADTLIGGFMKLIGQEEIWQNIKRGNAIDRAFAWFQGAMSELMAIVRGFPENFVTALRTLEVADFVALPSAFAKVGRVFGSFLGQFFRWAGGTIWDLLEIVFSVVAPAVITYVKKAAGAFKKILNDPVAFVKNLVRAGKLGFEKFAGNFVNHLKGAMIGWLTGSLSGAGIYIPQALSLVEIGKFVLSVLGITWEKIRAKIVKVIGEPAMVTLEGSFDVVVALVNGGPAAAWEVIKEKLSNLQDMVIGAITGFIKDKVVTAAVTKLLSMLSPAGAFIQAIIATYNTVMFFVERLRQIAAVVATFIDSISAIANGVVDAAAAKVESTLAGLLTMVISFLARIAGLGNVAEAVTGFIRAVQARVDQALDAAITWIVNQAKRLGKLVATAAGSVVQWWRARKAFQARDGSAHTLYFQGEGPRATLTVATSPRSLAQVLRDVAPLVSASGAPAARSALASANDLFRKVQTLQARVIGAGSAPTKADVDGLNENMAELARLLADPLLPLLYPASATDKLKVKADDVIKVQGERPPALIRGVSATMVTYAFITASARLAGATISTAIPIFNEGWNTKFSLWSGSLRSVYMGSNPAASEIGPAIKTRMMAQGIFRTIDGVEQILYREDRQWHPLSQCELGHLVNAVTWWNTNGRATGAQSAAVKAFMENPNNYEFEPKAGNRSRGARAGAQENYLPPLV